MAKKEKQQSKHTRITNLAKIKPCKLHEKKNKFFLMPCVCDAIIHYDLSYLWSKAQRNDFRKNDGTKKKLSYKKWFFIEKVLENKLLWVKMYVKCM